MGIKHVFHSGISDAADATKVRPSNWNADHTIDGDVDFNGHSIVNAVGTVAGPAGPPGADGTRAPDYVDIRDHGTVVGGGNITAALQAAINFSADATNNPGGGRVIRIPWVDSGIYQLDALTWPAGCTGIVLEFANHRTELTATLAPPGGTWIRGVTLMNTGLGIGITPNYGTDLCGRAGVTPLIFWNTVDGYCKVSNLNLGSSPSGLSGSAVKIGTGTGYTIENCSLSGGLAGCPVIDINTTESVPPVGGGVFWVDIINCKISCRDDILGPTNDHVYAIDARHGGIMNVRHIIIAGGKGIYLSGTNFAGLGSCIFDDILVESFGGPTTTIPNSFITMDATRPLGGAVNGPIFRNLAIADATAPVHTFKNLGGNSDVIHDYQPDYDPTSDPVRIMSFETGVFTSAGLPKQVPTYNQDWGRQWQTAIDKKLVSAPRCPQNTIGTVINIEQDPANWFGANATTPTITTGILAPDGSTMAGRVAMGTGSAVAFQSFAFTANLGDWFIGGCWVQAVDPTSQPIFFAPTIVFYPFGGEPTFRVNGGNDGSRLGELDASSQVIDGAWVWMAKAFKVTTAATNFPTSFWFLLGSVDGGSLGTSANFFNPCLQRVAAGSAFTDSDIIAYTRSLKGGWSSKCVAGDVGVLNHQPFRIAGGVRIRSTSASPSTGTGAVGDISWNTAPAVGQPKGWQCTVAGTPGTWVSMGNL